MDKLKNKIIKLLKKNPRGLTITDLAKITSHSRVAINKRLAILRAEKKVEVQQVNMAKLHYWVGGKK